MTTHQSRVSTTSKSRSNADRWFYVIVTTDFHGSAHRACGWPLAAFGSYALAGGTFIFFLPQSAIGCGSIASILSRYGVQSSPYCGRPYFS
jgi:hypothetical protein